jgi:endonuclease/exonuclease/phosphatase family metal-dependent hydrolase
LKTGFLFPLNIFISTITVLLYCTPYIPPSELWIAAFLSLLIPAFIIFNLFFSVCWLFKNRRRALLSLMVITVGYSFIFRTITYSFNNKDEEAGGLKVINYNVRIFNTYKHLQDENKNSSKGMIQWLVSSDAQILCLEEFYNDKRSELYNTITKLEKPFPYYYYNPFLINTDSSSFGMAIFSKLPIINSGYLKFSTTTNNQIMFADIIFQKDTIRIYNMHLQSMSIKTNDLTFSDGSWKGVFKKIKKGAIQRTGQIKTLMAHIQDCPYPIIVCGDLNDTPYSYSYQSLRKHMNNSFEKAGSGAGFTYNGKLYLRIDNQFSSSELKIRNFTTHNEIKCSDHFPVEGVYSFDE